MSLWEFQAAVGGYIKANTPPDEQATTITAAEAEQLAALIDEPPVWH